jgi:hypothetical protein
MKYQLFIFLIIIFTINSCKNNSETSSDSNTYESTSNSENLDEDAYDEIDGYKDGDYCAEIDYYYNKTGTSSRYTLKVEIESNELVKIYWPNGGWLDNSHFNPPDISDGEARFESDQGVEYKVRIIGEDGECNYSLSADNEDNLIKQAEDEICPKCGRDKYSWKKLCNRCLDDIEDEIKDKEEHTCKRCGKFDNFMFSTDDYCSDCEDEIEENERKKEEQNE